MEKHKDYFEGILQLRNTNEEVLDFVLKTVKNRDISLISKSVKVKNGIDLYLTSQKYLQTLGKKLKKHFHGELKISSKLFTRNRLTQKNVYRVNLLFRMPNFKKNDILTYKGERIKILGVGKKILAKNMNTGKKLNLSFKDLEN